MSQKTIVKENEVDLYRVFNLSFPHTTLDFTVFIKKLISLHSRVTVVDVKLLMLPQKKDPHRRRRPGRAMGSGVATPGAGPVAEPALNQVSRMREVLVLTQSPRGRKGDAGEVEELW